MLAMERFDLIKDRLRRDGKVVANDLATEFDVSEDTIRRDLRHLARLGFCRKVYGGAILSVDIEADEAQVSSIMERANIQVSAKHLLAGVAARLIKPSQTILMDAGTTNIAIAASIPKDIPLTVVTNAPEILRALEEHLLVHVIMLGGLYNRDKGACLGAATLNELEKINADMFFLGACGLDGTIGVTAFDHAEADVKRAMIKRSANLVVAATRDKIPLVAPFQIARPQELNHLIVENSVDQKVINQFQIGGTNIHYAE